MGGLWAQRELVNSCVSLGKVIIGINLLCLLAHRVDHSKHNCELLVIMVVLLLLGCHSVM